MRRERTDFVDGRAWRIYLCSYESPDGAYTFTIRAISMEHAAAMLADLKSTASLDGELMGRVSAADE